MRGLRLVRTTSCSAQASPLIVARSGFEGQRPQCVRHEPPTRVRLPGPDEQTGESRGGVNNLRSAHRSAERSEEGRTAGLTPSTTTTPAQLGQEGVIALATSMWAEEIATGRAGARRCSAVPGNCPQEAEHRNCPGQVPLGDPRSWCWAWIRPLTWFTSCEDKSNPFGMSVKICGGQT